MFFPYFSPTGKQQGTNGLFFESVNFAGLSGVSWLPQNLAFGTVPPSYFGNQPQMRGPHDYPPQFFPQMHGTPHQPYERGYPQGGYVMPQHPLGFQPRVYNPHIPRDGAFQQQHPGMNQQRAMQGSHPPAGHSYKYPNQGNAGKRQVGGAAPQQNGSGPPQPTGEKRGRLSIVNPITNAEVEIPTQIGANPHSFPLFSIQHKLTTSVSLRDPIEPSTMTFTAN